MFVMESIFRCRFVLSRSAARIQLQRSCHLPNKELGGWRGDGKTWQLNAAMENLEDEE